MEKENPGILFCFEKKGVDDRLQDKSFHDTKTPYELWNPTLPVEWFRYAPKTHMGNPFEIGKNMYKSPIFAGVPAVSL